MKIIEKVALTLFSTLILILSVIACLLVFGWLKVDFIAEILTNIMNDQVGANIVLGSSIVFILMAIRCIFFDSNSKESVEYKNGILLENENGRLLITKETIENLVKSITKGFDSAEDVTTQIELDKENSVVVFVHLNVKESANIKELVANLQNKIKDTIKKTSDLDVKEVNIKVKNIEPTKEIVEE